MLKAHITVRKGGCRLGQLLELARDFDPLQGRASGELALPTQPRRQREGAVGLVLAGLVEAAHAGREHGLERIDADFADLDQCFAASFNQGSATPSGPTRSANFSDARRRRAAIAVAASPAAHQVGLSDGSPARSAALSKISR